MSGFSPDWLKLREPADHAARNPQVLASVGTYFAGRKSLTVVDLGCGAGSNLRGTCGALPARQHWTLVDYDQELLDAARETLRSWAHEARDQGEELVLARHDKTITVDFRKADLNTDLEWILGWRPDLVTAAALFDLVSKRWIERFVAALVSQNVPLYTVLTYDGREKWRPPHSADAAMLAAFAHHQRTDKGFGLAAGPDAADTMAEAFRKSGFAVSTADSAWQIEAGQHELGKAVIQGIAAAVLQTGRVDPATVQDWLATRAASVTGFVGHSDLWARPV